MPGSPPQSPLSDSLLASSHGSLHLPEDDGMRQLRAKMLEIQELAISTADKASRMHALMTDDYIARRRAIISPPVQHNDHGHDTTDDGILAQYHVSPDDLVPSYAPAESSSQEAENTGDNEDGLTLGCVHYKRNVKIQCYDCQQWHNCRHCHDASKDLPFPHTLNRQMTENMLCMLCQTPQPAGETCINCEQDAAYYYCSKCKLWDNDGTKRIYHCDDCGICRRGEGLGKDYVHCKRCNVCISISTSSTHPCIERATDCDCPLCLEYLFSSSTPVVSLFCGHYMHAACYKDLMHVTYRCPVCSKSAVNMELQWRKLDDEIKMQPMPEEEFEVDLEDEASTPNLEDSTDTRLARGLRNLLMTNSPPRGSRKVPRRIWVGCNDCGGRGWTNFHWLGLKCPVCDGYNTNQMAPIGDSTRAPMPGTHFQRQHDFTGADTVRAFGGGLEPHEQDERADSAYGCIATSPASQPQRVPHDGPSSQRSYFLLAEAEALHRPIPSASGVREPYRLGGISPYDLLQNVSRSLSPMRSYVEGLDLRDRAASASRRMSNYAASVASKRFPSAEQPRPSSSVVEGEREELDFWGGDGQYSNEEGIDDSDEDELDSEEDDEDEDEEGSEIDADDIDGDRAGDKDDFMELFGHR